jgi:D-tyrosyl-tRNA(Tyr) deacylase
MRLVLQRVSEASVTVGGATVGSIRTGLVILAGVAKSDTESEVDFLSDKVLGLRVFPDSSGKMNRNVVEAGGSLLVVSQFTLYGDCRKGRRPSFDEAAAPEHAQALYNYFVERLRLGPVPVETGLFQAMMEVHLVNQGPVTILMDTADRNRK